MSILELIRFFPLLFYQQIFRDFFDPAAENSIAPNSISCGVSPYEPPIFTEPNINNNNSYEIIDGHTVQNASSLPWMAVLFDPPPYTDPCSGTIISEHHILTAGHCLLPYLMNKTHNYTGPWKPEETDWFTIHVGIVDWNDSNSRDHGGIKVHSRKIFPHPNFINDGSCKADIAIIELAFPLKFSQTVQPICLSHHSNMSLPGNNGVIAGWGQTEWKKYDLQSKLHDGIVKIEKSEVCTSKDPAYMPEESICCKAWPSDTCYGDSGGALLYKKIDEKRWFQLGVTVAYLGERTCHWPSIYTRVDNKCKWIEEVTNGSTRCF